MADAFVFLHRFGATALVAFAVLLGIWGAYEYFRHALVSGGFRSSYLLMAGLTAVQGLFGLGLFVVGHRPHTLLHLFIEYFLTLWPNLDRLQIPALHRVQAVQNVGKLRLDHKDHRIVAKAVVWPDQ